jgi:hypothetical protein
MTMMNNRTIEEELVNLINYEGYSSVLFMSERLDVDEDTIIDLLQKLLDAGELQGYISTDNERFYKSEVKVSSAPTLPYQEPNVKVEKPNQKPGIFAIVLGFIIIAIGLILPLFILEVAESGGNAVFVMGGFAALLSGLCYVSRGGVADIQLTIDKPM